MTRTSNVGQTVQTFYNYDTEGRVTRETIKSEKWTVKLAGFVLKTIAPLL